MKDIIRADTDMGTTLLQRLRLAFRGWQRRREDAQREFLKQNIQWGSGAAASSPASTTASVTQRQIDRDGLQVAFLDDSGQIDYYLDRESGDVVDIRDGMKLAEPRYRLVPRRTAQSDAEDRQAFAGSLDPSFVRQRLAAARDAAEFRQALAADRALERAWYKFKNDRAIAAIEKWLREIGL